MYNVVNGKKRKTAFLYGRVSSDEQALYGDSLRAQIEELRKWAKQNNFEILDEYIDDGYTARDLKRPELRRMLNDVKQYDVDFILFTKIDRWSRGVRNYYKLQDILDENGVAWKTIFEEYDTTTTAGRLHINMMLTIAENESNVTSDRIKVVFKSKVARGEVLTGAKRFGYDIVNKKLQINERETEIVRDLFNHYEQSMSISELTRYAATNYPEYDLTYRRLKSMLLRFLYVGTHVSAEYGIHENYCPQIISDEQFERVQRLVAMNKKAYYGTERKPIDYIFRSFMRCNVCGCKVGSTARRDKKRNKVYINYRCQKHYKGGDCDNNYNIGEIFLEKYLLRNIRGEIEKYKVNYKISEIEPKPTKKKINVDKIRKQLDKLLDAHLNDKIETATYYKKYDELHDLIKQAEKDERPQPKKDFTAIDEFLKMDLENIYYTLTPLERRRLWLSIIREIRVERNIIDIDFL